MSNDQLMDWVIARGGFANDGEAALSVRAVLSALAQRLSRSEAEALADELPSQWAEPLRVGRFDRAFDLPDLFARVARGLTQEREQETLATGTPSPGRPLAPSVKRSERQ